LFSPKLSKGENMTAQSIETTGGCLCGGVAFRIHGHLRGVVNCHCSKCRRFHGHFGAYTSVAFDQIEFTQDHGLKWFRSATDETPNVYRGFCAECGASLFWHPRDQATISVAAGSLNEPTGLKTIGHVWTGQIGDYYKIYDDHPTFDKGWPK
jgi:hypothetical protein